MKDIQTSRRAFLKGSTGTVGALAMPFALAMPATVSVPDDDRIRAQKAFIKAVLHKHVQGSDRIRRQHVEAFAQRFGEIHGLIDYHQHCGGLVGEYRLTRLFVRSLYLTGAQA